MKIFLKLIFHYLICVKKAAFLEGWFKTLCVEDTCQLDVQNKSIEDRKKEMISRAIQSLIEVYREKEQQAIAQKFEELKNKILVV